ncbi:MAG: hypothetical protein AABZ39_10785 [Spirochaetota bacterium]
MMRTVTTLVALAFLGVSCAHMNWDAGFSDEDRVGFLLQKSSSIADDADADIRNYIQARDILLRAMALQPRNAQAKSALASLESEIMTRKRNEYYAGRTSISQKRYVDAGVQFQRVLALRFSDKPEDVYDVSAKKSLNAIAPQLRKDIEALLKSADRKWQAKDTKGATDIYLRILRADPGNGTASGRIAEREDRLASEAHRYFDLGKRAYDARQYDTAVSYLNRSYWIKKDDATFDLLNRIAIMQANRRHVANAEAYIAKNDHYDALRLYRRCKLNDPLNSVYDAKIRMLTEKLTPSVDGWYNEAVQKYNESDFEAAVDLFERVTTVSENYKDARNFHEKSRQKLDAALRAVQ